MNQPLNYCIQELEDLAINNFAVSVRADNLYTQKMAGKVAHTYLQAATIVKEAAGRFQRNLTHSDKSVGEETGG